MCHSAHNYTSDIPLILRLRLSAWYPIGVLRLGVSLKHVHRWGRFLQRTDSPGAPVPQCSTGFAVKLYDLEAAARMGPPAAHTPGQAAQALPPRVLGSLRAHDCSLRPHWSLRHFLSPGGFLVPAVAARIPGLNVLHHGLLYHDLVRIEHVADGHSIQRLCLQ